MVLGHTSMEMIFSRYARYIPEASAEHVRKLLKLFQMPDAAAEGEITNEITAPHSDSPLKEEKSLRARVSKRRSNKMGQMRGIEPPYTDTTNQCLNHLATSAITLCV